MSKPTPQRIWHEPRPDELQRLEAVRALIAAELPELIDRNRRARMARREPTPSGRLRHAIHTSGIPLIEVAKRVGITPIALSEFLTGERAFPPEVLDRLAQVLGYPLKPVS